MITSTAELVDSHCHLDFPEFAAELDAVVARAREAGVGRLLTICTRLSKFHEVLAIAERFDRMFCSVGVHPHEAAHEADIALERIVALTKHPKVVGIGEAGLDYYYDKSPRERQQEVFRLHIEAARQTGLPLIVHSRDADEDTAALLREGADKGGQPGALRGVIHCFTATQYLADAALEMGFFISLSGIVTFKNAEALRAVAKTVPLDRLLVETDSPYLAPMPMRGKRNEPSFVRHTATYVAEMLGIPFAELAARTTANFERLFDKTAARAAT
jgi:TatD DNase family protein